MTDYFAQFAKRDEAQKKLIGTVVNGREYTEQDYKQWRLAQIGRGKRFEALRDRLAERMTGANQVAAAYMNDATPGIYALNRNFAAYTIEQQVGADVGFDIWDEQTVKRLIVEQPDLMPYYPPARAVKRGIDLAYGKRQITAQVTSGILQGESIKHLADRLQTNIPNMNQDSAIRAARTAVTGAQNAGRQESYSAAAKMGIELEKEWLATLDGRTRHSHGAADGQSVAEDEPFSVGGAKLMYPGDPFGPAHEIYNCRCTTIAKVKGVDTSDAKRRARDLETGESAAIENMTYAQWAEGKRQAGKVYLQNQADSDTIKNIGNEYQEIKITQKVIEKIPLLSPEGWNEKKAEKLREANRLLLKAVKDRELGTEAGQIFDLEMAPLTPLILGETASKSIRLPGASVPYVAIHNHPDGFTFSEKDVETFVFDYDMRIMEAVGHNGNVYLLQKAERYQAAKFIKAFAEQGHRLTQSQTPQEYADQMNQILKEAEQYGVRFITGG